MPSEQFQRFRALDSHLAAFDPLKRPLPAADGRHSLGLMAQRENSNTLCKFAFAEIALVLCTRTLNSITLTPGP